VKKYLKIQSNIVQKLQKNSFFDKAEGSARVEERKRPVNFIYSTFSGSLLSRGKVNKLHKNQRNTPRIQSSEGKYDLLVKKSLCGGV